MRTLSFVFRNPVPVLGALALAFAGWVVFEGTGDRPSAQVPPFPGGPQHVFLDGAIPPLTPQATAETLPRLKPGMTRAEVEELVGAPKADGVGPATASGDRLVYHAAYEADLNPPATVRPIHATSKIRHLPRPPVTEIVFLEFDASRPGHPLVGVHYPDPLF
jgi:hypothetical protein